MIEKRILEKKVRVQLKASTNTRQPITPEMIIECKGFLPGDIILDLGYQEVDGTNWGSDEDVSQYYPYIMVIRKVEETDDEYMKRIAIDERVKNENEKRDRLEYLRLKAKYEGSLTKEK